MKKKCQKLADITSALILLACLAALFGVLRRSPLLGPRSSRPRERRLGVFQRRAQFLLLSDVRHRRATAKWGNTLVTESDDGRPFEVTPTGEIVWEFHNPHRAGDDDELVATLIESARVDKGFFPWLESDPPD